MATVTKRGRRYSIRFRHDGRQHRVAVSGGRAKAESVKLIVEATLTDLKLHRLTIPPGVNAGEFIASGGKAVPKRPKITFTTAATLWQGSRTAADTTLAGEAKHVRHLKAFFGETELTKIDPQKYVDHRLSSVSSTTVQKELVTLSSIVKTMKLLGNGVIDFQPDQLRMPLAKPAERFTSLASAKNGRRVLLSHDEVTDLRKVIRENGSALIADVADFVALTGARRSEVCRLKPTDIDLKAGTITITELKRKHGHTTYRTLAIHPDLRPILSRRLTSGAFIFTDSINTLSAGLQEAIEGTRFDVPGFGFHALRHSAASRLLARNVSPVTVANVLGHADTRTTLAVYAHAFADDCTAAVQML